MKLNDSIFTRPTRRPPRLGISVLCAVFDVQIGEAMDSPSRRALGVVMVSATTWVRSAGLKLRNSELLP